MHCYFEVWERDEKLATFIIQGDAEKFAEGRLIMTAGTGAKIEVFKCLYGEALIGRALLVTHCSTGAKA